MTRGKQRCEHGAGIQVARGPGGVQHIIATATGTCLTFQPFSGEGGPRGGERCLLGNMLRRYGYVIASHRSVLFEGPQGCRGALFGIVHQRPRFREWWPPGWSMPVQEACDVQKGEKGGQPRCSICQNKSGTTPQPRLRKRRCSISPSHEYTNHMAAVDDVSSGHPNKLGQPVHTTNSRGAWRAPVGLVGRCAKSGAPGRGDQSGRLTAAPELLAASRTRGVSASRQEGSGGRADTMRQTPGALRRGVTRDGFPY